MIGNPNVEMKGTSVTPLGEKVYQYACKTADKYRVVDNITCKQ